MFVVGGRTHFASNLDSDLPSGSSKIAFAKNKTHLQWCIGICMAILSLQNSTMVNSTPTNIVFQWTSLKCDWVSLIEEQKSKQHNFANFPWTQYLSTPAIGGIKGWTGCKHLPCFLGVAHSVPGPCYKNCWVWGLSILKRCHTKEQPFQRPSVGSWNQSAPGLP